MRDKEKKHRKGQETTIGKIIYGFLLFMPLIAIATTCLYTIFNKNAYQSYADYQNEEIVNVSLNEQLESGVTYQININSLTYVYGYQYYVLDGQTNIRELYTPNENYTVDRINMICEGQRLRIQWFSTNNTQYNHFLTNLNDYTTPIWFVSNGNNTFGTNQTYYSLTTLTYTSGKLSDVFYYAVDKVTENPLFSWAENSIIYTTTANTCTALSITTPFIPLLLAYWLIISVIYFLYDIALMLVWLIHRKIHELQESL